jgi:hypothetical protein
LMLRWIFLAEFYFGVLLVRKCQLSAL